MAVVNVQAVDRKLLSWLAYLPWPQSPDAHMRAKRHMIDHDAIRFDVGAWYPRGGYF